MPEQVVAEPQLSACAYEQVGVGHEAGGEVLVYGGFVDAFDGACSFGGLAGYLADSLGDFPFGGIAQGDDHGHACVGAGALLAVAYAGKDIFGHSAEVAYYAHPDVVFHEDFLFHGLKYELHQGGHFGAGRFQFSVLKV